MHSTPSQDAVSHRDNDDLDLLLILAIAGRFLKKNGRNLLLSAVAGLFCGLILYFSLPKFYTSKLLLESQVLNNTETKAVIENWNGMLRPSGYPYLMKEFECDRGLLANTANLSAEPLNPQNETQAGIILTVSVRDTSKLAALQTALLNGFRDNDYISRRVELHRKGVIDEMKKAEEEMNKLDSTKQFIEGTVESVRKDKSPLILDISEISAQKIKLIETKAGLEERLEFIDGVLLIQGFSAAAGPKPGMMAFLSVGFLAGFLISYFLIVFQTLKNRVSKLKFQ